MKKSTPTSFLIWSAICAQKISRYDCAPLGVNRHTLGVKCWCSLLGLCGHFVNFVNVVTVSSF